MTEGPTRKYSVLKGDIIELICGESLDSHPEATVTWTSPKSGEIRSDDERYIMSSGPNVVLIIKNVTSGDNGTWKCTVENNGVAKFCQVPDKSKRNLEVDILLDVIGKYSVRERDTIVIVQETLVNSIIIVVQISVLSMHGNQ